MAFRNPHLASLAGGYLFPEINKRKEAFLKKNPDAHLISLGIGDTTEPLAPSIATGMAETAAAFGTREGYRGYSLEAGDQKLRELIAAKVYVGRISPDAVFISDGAKCDAGRLQFLFGRDASIAVQDPAYPVYLDTSRIMGRGKIHTMPCLPENGFFPKQIPEADLIYFCSPNNPTGAVATYEQLEALVAHARRCGSIILYDAAYAAFIQSGPRSIFEIPGAEEVAIEMGSFSKMAGFTGIRLGWTVVPEELKFADGAPVRPDWNRIVSVFFNGASRIATAGGCIALSDRGLKEINETVAFYLENAKIISNALADAGFTVYGGTDAPYLWATLPGQTSWGLFEALLEKAHLLTIPGAGFGAGGEGFIRLSAFGRREDILAAAERIKSEYD